MTNSEKNYEQNRVPSWRIKRETHVDGVVQARHIWEGNTDTETSRVRGVGGRGLPRSKCICWETVLF